MKVAEIMNSPVITVREDATLKDIIEVMLDHHVLGLPVINSCGHLVGIVTESDFVIREPNTSQPAFRIPGEDYHGERVEDLRSLYRTALTTRAHDVMTSPVMTVTEQDSVRKVIKLMLTHDIGRVPVIRGKIPVGIVTCHDLLELMAHKFMPENPAAGVLEPAG